jgi:hypothetical protein
LSCSAAAAKELLDCGFADVGYGGNKQLPTSKRQLCYARLIRDLTAIAEWQALSTEIRAEKLAMIR